MTVTSGGMERAPSRNRRHWLRWGGYMAGGVVSLLLVLACRGALYQWVASHRDRRLNPPPGQFVDVGGYRLHLYCIGSGSPTVVLDSGLSDSSLAWYKVQPQLAEFTRVCAYDRAGLGWSDPSPRPRTSRVIVEELHTLLHKAGIAAPFVLVGHSFGGYNVRMYASLYSAEVVVLVDSCHPEQEKRFPPELKQYNEDLLRRQGLRVVLSEDPEKAWVIPGLSLGLAKDMSRQWDEMQAELVHLSADGSRLIAKGSGHMVHQDRPDLVIEAIHKVVEQCRESQPSLRP